MDGKKRAGDRSNNSCNCVREKHPRLASWLIRAAICAGPKVTVDNNDCSRPDHVKAGHSLWPMQQRSTPHPRQSPPTAPSPSCPALFQAHGAPSSGVAVPTCSPHSKILHSVETAIQQSRTLQRLITLYPRAHAVISYLAPIQTPWPSVLAGPNYGTDIALLIFPYSDLAPGDTSPETGSVTPFLRDPTTPSRHVSAAVFTLLNRLLLACNCSCV